MKIFGHPASTCTRKVLMTLNETKTPFEFVLVDFAKGEHKQPPHLARQPFGQVPALDDDGFEMYESRAMARYIDGKAGAPLTPKEAQARALMEEWISIETSNYSGHAMKFIYHSVFKREQAPEVLKHAGAGLDLAYGTMDKRLASSPYLAGESFSIADLCFMPYLEYLALSPAAAKLDEHPHVAAWWKRVSARETWGKTVGR
ncbi:MAG TPA: glutathione S-transferase N-terminal domain-containing protein [Polyangiaceae bacterium]|nr:glutathione S-transferase N-terminal domain-containing protein [Polyangiaceae bacterium]